MAKFLLPERYDIFDKRGNPIARASKDALKIYPVPASEQLAVTWPALPEGTDARIQVIDLLGRQHLTQPIDAKETNCTLRIANLPEGVYFLVIRDTRKLLHRTKFTVQH